MKLLWNYTDRHINVSIRGYIERVLAYFKVDMLARPQHSPHIHIQPNYGGAIQYTAPINISKPLSVNGAHTVQETIGTLMYYTHAVDSIILSALGNLGQQQTKSTKNNAKAIENIIAYVATHPDTTVRYHTSNMSLHFRRDASYLSSSNIRSRIGGTSSFPPRFPPLMSHFC